MIYSSLRQSKRINLVEEVPLSGPLSIYIETTNICNFRCTFCPESFENYEEKTGGFFQMSFASFKKIADQIKDLNTVVTLNFYMMGEPFVNKELTDFIKYSKQHNIAKRTIVTSNGTLIKSKKYQDIIDSRLDFLRVSIYGGNEASHKKNTQNSISLAKIKDNIQGLKHYRDQVGSKTPYIYLKMIESSDAQENDSFLDYFDEVGDEVCLEPVMNWNNPVEGNLAGVEGEVLLGRNSFSMKKEVCPFPFYTFVIHSDMRVSVCCVDWDKQTIIGDLRLNTLEEIWYGEKLREFQMKHLAHKRHELNGCKNCIFLHTAPDNIDKLTPEIFERREK
jgi:sulfatase maturation enzyme AslB (radical SAM superfamily)